MKKIILCHTIKECKKIYIMKRTISLNEKERIIIVL